jgi:hypothetical protein
LSGALCGAIAANEVGLKILSRLYAGGARFDAPNEPQRDLDRQIGDDGQWYRHIKLDAEPVLEPEQRRGAGQHRDRPRNGEPGHERAVTLADAMLLLGFTGVGPAHIGPGIDFYRRTVGAARPLQRLLVLLVDLGVFLFSLQVLPQQLIVLVFLFFFLLGMQRRGQECQQHKTDRDPFHDAFPDKGPPSPRRRLARPRPRAQFNEITAEIGLRPGGQVAL